jgi:hypothetical protein
MTKVVNFTKQKTAFINSYDPNKLAIQYKKLSVILNFQKNLSDRNSPVFVLKASFLQEILREACSHVASL